MIQKKTKQAQRSLGAFFGKIIFVEEIHKVRLSEVFNNYTLLFSRLQIEESSKPVRLSQQLDKAVTTNYKPVANHQYNVSYLLICFHTSIHPSDLLGI